MTTLRLALLLALASSLTALPGCFLSSSDDDGVAGGAAQGSGGQPGDDVTASTGAPDAGSGGGEQTFQNLTVDWSILAYDGAPDPCVTPYTHVKVSAQAVDRLAPPHSYLGDPFESVFDCTDGTATIRLPTSGRSTNQDCRGTACLGAEAIGITGAYFVTLFLTEETGEVEQFVAPILENESDPRPRKETDLSLGDGKLDFELRPNAGFILADWYLYAESDLAELSCAAATVDRIEVRTKRMTDEAGNEIVDGLEVVDSYPCTGQPGVDTHNVAVGAGISSALLPGYYRIEPLAYSGTNLVGRVAAGNEPDLIHVRPGAKVQALFPDFYDALIIGGF